MSDTGWRAKAIADHLSELLSEEIGIVYDSGKQSSELTEVEEARIINRRKSTFFAKVGDDGRQYRVSVSIHEWRERGV